MTYSVPESKGPEQAQRTYVFDFDELRDRCMKLDVSVSCILLNLISRTFEFTDEVGSSLDAVLIINSITFIHT